MGSVCLLSDGGRPSVSCVTHYSFVRSLFVRSFVAAGRRPAHLQLGAGAAHQELPARSNRAYTPRILRSGTI